MKKQTILIFLGLLLLLSCKKEGNYLNSPSSFPYENEQMKISVLHQMMGMRFISKVHFINANDGVLLSDGKIYKTTNGGKSWDLKFNNDSAETRLSHLLFADNNTAYATGIIYSENGSRDRAFLLHSTDAGNSWNVLFEEKGHIEFGAISVNAIGDLFVICNGITQYSTKSKSILKSTDKGRSWKSVFSSNEHFLNDITFNGNTGFAGGTVSLNNEPRASIILKSMDNGETWAESARLAEAQIWQITFKEGVGYCNAHSAVYQTNNNGSDWKLIYKNPNYYVSNMECLTAQNCILTGIGPNTMQGCFGYTGSFIAQSSDAGINWNTVLLQHEQVLQPLSFYTSNEGYAFDGNNFLRVQLK